MRTISLLIALAFVLGAYASKTFAQYPPYQNASVAGSTCSVVGITQVISGASNGLAWGATITTGGASTYLGWCNGTNWTVIGK